MNENQLTN